MVISKNSIVGDFCGQYQFENNDLVSWAARKRDLKILLKLFVKRHSDYDYEINQYKCDNNFITVVVIGKKDEK